MYVIFFFDDLLYNSIYESDHVEATSTSANTCPETLAAELLVHQVPFVTFDVAYQHGCPTGRDNGGLEPCHAEAHDDIRRVPNEIVIA